MKFYFSVLVLALSGMAAAIDPPGVTTEYYVGTIGTSPIRMRLERNGTALEGAYFYTSGALILNLHGKMEENGTVTLDESSGAGKKSGSFTGKLDAENSVLVWHSADGKKKISIHLVNDPRSWDKAFPLTATTYRRADVETSCLLHGDAYANDLVPCQVGKWKNLGTADGRELWIARFDFLPSKPGAKGYAVFDAAPKSNDLHLIWQEQTADPDEAFVEAPELIDSKAGKLIQTQTGSGNAVRLSHFFKWNGKEWAELDTDSWKKKITLPQGLNLASDTIDWQQFSFESDVQKPGDCHACATGGKVTATLDLRGTQLVVKSFKYSPEAP